MPTTTAGIRAIIGSETEYTPHAAQHLDMLLRSKVQTHGVDTQVRSAERAPALGIGRPPGLGHLGEVEPRFDAERLGGAAGRAQVASQAIKLRAGLVIGRPRGWEIPVADPRGPPQLHLRIAADPDRNWPPHWQRVDPRLVD